MSDAETVSQLALIVDRLAAQNSRRQAAIEKLDVAAERQQAVVDEQWDVIRQLQSELQRVQRRLAMLEESTAKQRERDLEWRAQVDQLLDARDNSAAAATATRGDDAADGGGDVDDNGPVARVLSSGAVSATRCADAPVGPQLIVNGVCSCSEDALIGNRSVATELENLAATMQLLQQAVSGGQ